MKNLNLILLSIISLILLVSVNAATVSHPASEITAGIFDPGDFTITNNQEVFLAIKNIEDGGHDYRLVSAGSAGGIGIGKFSIFDNTAGQSRLTIASNGNVGIGTTSPTSKLDVAGEISVNGGISVTGEIQLARVAALGSCDGTNLGAVVFETASDEPYVCASTGWVSMSGPSGPDDTDGDGEPDTTDCSPNDETEWQVLSCYIDNDGDGVRSSFTTTVCSGTTCAGSTASPGTDCDGWNGAKWQNLACYTDNDGDGYGKGASTLCTGSSCPSGYASSGGDCYDLNSNARPDQTKFFATNRGDGSFDYDCDGSETGDIGGCVSTIFQSSTCIGVPSGIGGWVGSVPACGETGTLKVCEYANYPNDFCGAFGLTGSWVDSCLACPTGHDKYHIQQYDSSMRCR